MPRHEYRTLHAAYDAELSAAGAEGWVVVQATLTNGLWTVLMSRPIEFNAGRALTAEGVVDGSLTHRVLNELKRVGLARNAIEVGIALGTTDVRSLSLIRTALTRLHDAGLVTRIGEGKPYLFKARDTITVFRAPEPERNEVLDALVMVQGSVLDRVLAELKRRAPDHALSADIAAALQMATFVGRKRVSTALSRLTQMGLVERVGTRKPYSFRVATTNRAYAAAEEGE